MAYLLSALPARGIETASEGPVPSPPIKETNTAMLNPFKRPRRVLGVAGALTGALLATAALAGPAGASAGTYSGTIQPSGSEIASGNSILVGSGSSTTYYMMEQLDLLFNNSQGCQIYDPTGANQPLNLECATDAPGYAQPETLGAAAGENPYNDVAVEEPYIGSSNGIAQLKDANATGLTYFPSPIAYARSSRALKGSDPKGMNFVAYAKDGVDWVTFSSVPGQTVMNCLPGNNLSQTLITDIWEGTIANWAVLCADAENNTTSPTDGEVGDFASYDAPICVYDAQDGSGTLATWDTYTGITTENYIGTLTPNTTAASEASSYGLSTTFVNDGCYDGDNSTNYGNTHQIFENETEQLIANGAKQTGSGNQYSDTADSIFFYSFGRFTLDCKAGTNHSICQPIGFALHLGEIGNQYPTKTDIIATDNPKYKGTAWAVPRYLYNVYGNGDTSAGVPAATPATVNYVSEVGFLCKPQTETELVSTPAGPEPGPVDIMDPVTGKSYVSEISSAITKNGFFRLPLQTGEDQVASLDGYYAESLLSAYTGTDTQDQTAFSVFDPNYNTLDTTDGTTATDIAEANSSTNLADSNPSGYCKAFTTG